MHANAECQTDPNKSGDCTLLLTAEIEHQKTTISSLRILLEQHRAEIEALQKHSLDCSDKKENCDNQVNFRVADLERKLRFSETKVVKLAAEVRYDKPFWLPGPRFTAWKQRNGVWNPQSPR